MNGHESGQQAFLGARVLRSVFAFLIMHHNRTVTTGRIIDAVWDDHPPPTARTQVHSRISHLRRLLRPVQEYASVQTLPGGYCPHTDPSQVDTAIFESTVGEGFALLARGHTHDALNALDAALNLWRGSPLAGVEARFARTEATRLEELRLTVLDRGVGLHLRAGHHAEVTAQLSAAGRRADAVAVYHRAARQMREELGLDPSPETAELFAAILRADGNAVFRTRSTGLTEHSWRSRSHCTLRSPALLDTCQMRR